MKDLLSNGLQSLKELCVVLQREQQSLAQNNAELLEQCAVEKQPLIQHLNDFQQSWQSKFSTMGLPCSNEGMDLYIHNLHSSQQVELQDLWRAFAEQGKICQTLNQVNGNVIAINSKHLKQLLAILHGQSLSPSTYGPNGEILSKNNTPPLAQA